MTTRSRYLDEIENEIALNAEEQGSPSGTEAVFEIGIYLDMIREVMEFLSSFCGGSSASQTASVMKSPSGIQKALVRIQCNKQARKYVTRPSGMSKKDWRKSRRDLREDYSYKVYAGLRKTADEKTTEEVADIVEAYRS
jgi:hypothetical protein